MRRRMLLAAGGAMALPSPGRAQSGSAGGGVDVALVMAVDVSRSVDEDEARLQREGYRAAMSDPRVVAAITGGMLGAVAVAYVEWAGFAYQQLVVPWTRIGSAGDAAAWSAQLAGSPRSSMSWTSISGALQFSRQVLAACPFEPTRRVIDVSGDGVNNQGPPPEEERDRLAEAGVTINGLPIVNDRPNFGVVPSRDLEPYFRNSVIGGPGAFLIAAEDFNAFGDAIRRKLIQEIA
ncbi:MAG: DUF1194 domain-containing protein [Gemmatimonadaceae bacterium]|nr:DUF1194 domain-containing protein [Acetobacteraceae bacterium]